MRRRRPNPPTLMNARGKRALKRYAENFLREQGLTRDALEKRLGKVLRPRPRWVPKWLWRRFLLWLISEEELQLVLQHSEANPLDITTARGVLRDSGDELQ